MAIDIDKAVATKLLHNSYMACSRSPITTCAIKSTIDFVMSGKNCLTYRYIMFTALLAKAVNPAIDILSLQAGDASEGAYDARSLASKVVYKFQATLLGNVLDGSNSDPLVNKPGRYMHLSPDNAAAGGDPQTALRLLCQDLVKIDTSEQAKTCVDYLVSLLLAEKKKRDEKNSHFQAVAADMSVFHVRQFMSDLLDQGFGGSALVLVTAAIYHLQFPEEEYKVVAHPANQSGSSKRQFSDLDVYFENKPFMGTELKDKPFSAADVDHAAETAFNAGATSILFIAGRQSTFASQPPTYFSNTREKYAMKGMYVGVTSIDALMDTLFSFHMSTSAIHLLDIIRDTAEEIGALEAQLWIYEHITDVIK